MMDRTNQMPRSADIRLRLDSSALVYYSNRNDAMQESGTVRSAVHRIGRKQQSTGNNIKAWHARVCLSARCL